MEKRNGLVSEVCLTHASGTAEREAALVLLDRRPGRSRITLGVDKGYGAAALITELRARSVKPRVAVDRRTSKLVRPHRSAVDARTTRHRGYAGLRQTRFRGVDRVGRSLSLAATAYNLICLSRLLETPT